MYVGRKNRIQNFDRKSCRQPTACKIQEYVYFNDDNNEFSVGEIGFDYFGQRLSEHIRVNIGSRQVVPVDQLLLGL
jgi:hypothetical protein